MRRNYLAPLLALGGAAACAALLAPGAHRIVGPAGSGHDTFRTCERIDARQTPLPSQSLQETLFPRRRRPVLPGDSYDDVLQLTPAGSVGLDLTACTPYRFSPEVTAHTFKNYQSFLGIRRE